MLVTKELLFWPFPSWERLWHFLVWDSVSNSDKKRFHEIIPILLYQRESQHAGTVQYALIDMKKVQIDTKWYKYRNNNLSKQTQRGCTFNFFSFFRCFGPKCGGCGEKIHYQDFVRKARDKVYHLRCFTCSLCSKQLSTGEVLYLQPGEEGFVCKDHYLNKGKTKSKATYIYIGAALPSFQWLLHWVGCL